MSTLATTYANSVGIRLPKKSAEFPTMYVKIPKKYITFYTGGGSASVTYDHYNKAVELIREPLKENGIVIVQVGVPADVGIEGALDYRGKSNFRQTAFIIENSLLHIGNDSVWNHVAGVKKVPFICPCGPTPALSIEPYYKETFSILESHREGRRPSYDTSNKDINLVNPEEVAERMMEFLNIPWKSPIKTVRIGKNYTNKQIDYIPDFPLGPELRNKRIAVRLDIVNNFQNLNIFLGQYKGPIVAKDPLPPDFLDHFKPNIAEIIYLCDDNFNIHFIKKLQTLGIKYTLITEKTGKALGELKLKLLDYNPPLTKKKVDLSSIPADSYFSSERLFLAGGRFYPSLEHYRRSIPIEICDFKVEDFLESEDFEETIENFYIYQKI